MGRTVYIPIHVQTIKINQDHVGKYTIVPWIDTMGLDMFVFFNKGFFFLQSDLVKSGQMIALREFHQMVVYLGISPPPKKKIPKKLGC